MKILEPETNLPDFTFSVSHFPGKVTGKQGYRLFAPCLRWEFGFFCAFCLLHETDFSRLGVKGLGIFWIEHYYTRSAFPHLINEYSNCLYSCRMCNSARRDLSTKSKQGADLLNPREHVWSESFGVDAGCNIVNKASTEDSNYTFTCYDLGDTRKGEMKRVRKEAISESIRLIEELPDLLDTLIKRGDFRRAEQLRRQLLLTAERFLVSYATIPANADEECMCSSSPDLPVWAEERSWEL